MVNRVLTIMLTDIKGFTERTSSISREEMRNLLKDHEDLLLPVIKKFRGTKVKNIGDAFLVTFESPTNAVLCAVMIQDTLRTFNEEKEDKDKIQIRIAINAGEVDIRDGDVFGEAVNTAARIEGITDANEIYFTEAVYLAMNKTEVPTSEIGLRRFKGIPEPVKLYRVIQDHESEKYKKLINKLRTQESPNGFDILPVDTGKRPVRLGLIIGIAVIVLCGIAFFLVLPGIHSWSLAGRKQEIITLTEKGDFNLALARADKMMEEYPDEKEAHEAMYAVVEAEARALKKDKKYDDALKLLNERKKERKYLNTDEIEKEILLKKGSVYALKNNYRVSSGVFRYLVDKFTGDEEVLSETVKYMGVNYTNGPTSIGVVAAYHLAELRKGPLDDLIGETLTEGYLDEQPFSDYTVSIREILIKRYEPAVKAAKTNIASTDYERRINSYNLLREAGRITSEEELKYHFDNLRLLSRSYRKVGQQSITYLRNAAKASDWKKKKKAAGIGTIKDVKALHSWSDYQRDVSSLLAEAFFAEIEPTIQVWLREEKNEFLRINAFQLLNKADRLDKVDVWAHHAKTLVNYDLKYTPRSLTRALDYFKEFIGKEKEGDARKAVEAGRDYVNTSIAKFKKAKQNWRIQDAERGLALIQEALKAFDRNSDKK